MPSWSSAVLAVSIGVAAAAAWTPASRRTTEVPGSESRLRPVRSSRENPDGPFRLKAELRTNEARPVVGLVPSADPQVTAALVEGARLAFEEARAAGGPDLALVVGASTSTWSSAASEAVRLACDERVIALIGPPERSMAHPVAQAATRCRVPMLSTSRAASVTAAGSNQVMSVAPTDASEVDLPSLARDEWVAAGRDAARVAVESVRRGGLSRAAFLVAASEATAVTKRRESPRSK